VITQIHPALVLALMALVLLAVARLTRRTPAQRLFLGPLTGLALVVAVAIVGGPALQRLVPDYWALCLLPLLVLLVRASVVVFELSFKRGRGESPPALLGSLVSVLLYGLGAGFIAHRAFGIELTPFLATSAVVGAVVGLALQDTLGNLFAGIALHTEGPFRVGDWVKVGETEGRVVQVSWRGVRLTTWSGDGVTIPNNEVSRRSVLNYSQPAAPHSRTVQVGVSYATPPNKVLGVLADMLPQVPGLLPEPAPRVRLVAYRESAMEYEVRYYVRAYEDYRSVESEIYRLIWYHFGRHGIEIPYPVRSVHLQRRPGRSVAVVETPAQRLERALRGIDLFRALSEEELQVALRNFRHLHYSAGERILEEGSPGDSFFLVDQGVVVVSKLVAGLPRLVAELGEGQFFGEMALLTGEARSATVTAKTDIDLYTIDKRGFEQIVVQNPHVTVDISSILVLRRDALSQAEVDARQGEESATTTTRKQDLLDRIRGYFGL
jgi:small-conductance mechanosensitive channel/CRP-like cAMP-binding protein